jgi:hypothetical protein
MIHLDRRRRSVTQHGTWLPPVRDVPVSATLAANEAMMTRRARGLPVLPLAFGEAGLPGATTCAPGTR